jgi:hypothetical protein
MAGDPQNEVTINSDGSIDGQVEINNGGEVKFQVSSYPAGMDVCTITITSSDVSWSASPIAGQNTIKVGN